MHFGTKVANTELGLSVPVISNEGQSGRRGVVEGLLKSLAVRFLRGYFSGETLSAVDSAELRIVVDAQMTQIETENVFTETETPVSENVVLVEAHMDSVVAGPGINDNGSGSLILLSMAK